MDNTNTIASWPGGYQVGKPAPFPVTRIKAKGGKSVDIGGGLPVSAEDPFGLGSLLGSGNTMLSPPPAVAPQTVAPSPLQAQIDTANTDIGNRRLELANTDDPYAEAGLKNKAQQATTLAEAVAMAANPPPQHQFTPIQPGSYPRMGTVPMPDRPDPHVNPLVAALAAFGGAFSPSAASHFGVSAIQGANDVADQQYQYDLNERRAKLQELSQAHDDEIAAHNEALKYAEANLRGKERTDYLNALGRYDYQTVLDKLKAAGKGQGVLDKGYGDLTGSARAREKLTAMLTNQLETRNQLIGQLQAQNAGNLSREEMASKERIAGIAAKSRVTVQDKRNEGQANIKFGRDVFNPVTGQMEHQQGQFETQKYGIDQRSSDVAARIESYDKAQKMIDSRVKGSAAYKGSAGPGGSNQLANTTFQRASISAQNANEAARKTHGEYLKLKSAGLITPEMEPAWTKELDRIDGLQKQAMDDFNKVKSGPSTAGPPKITGDADYSKLPSGTVFIGPDGQQRRKP